MYIYYSLISREKKDVDKGKCLYMTGIKRSKIKARKATKDVLYRSFQIFLNCSNLHYKFNWVLFVLDVTEDLIFFLSSIMNPRSHTFFIEYGFIYNKLNVIFNVKQNFLLWNVFFAFDKHHSYHPGEVLKGRCSVNKNDIFGFSVVSYPRLRSDLERGLQP